jgi:hypothetical protein
MSKDVVEPEGPQAMSQYSTHVCMHTHKMFDIYCFSTATMITQTHFSVMLYACCLCLKCSDVVCIELFTSLKIFVLKQSYKYLKENTVMPVTVPFSAAARESR